MKPITAYKYLQYHGKHFFSPLQVFEWQPGWNAIDNGPLDIDGRNGFYTYRNNPRENRDYLCGYPFVAEMEIAGKIVEHQNGFRSEYARINRVISDLGYIHQAAIDYLATPYIDNRSLPVARDNWPSITPYTKVYQVSDSVSQYRIPVYGNGGAGVSIHESDLFINPGILEIKLDLKKHTAQGWMQYGYNAEHDILVYRAVE